MDRFEPIIIDLPYYEDLNKIYEFMRTQRQVELEYRFPYSLCDHTSRLVSKVTGLEVVTGQFEKSKKEEKYIHTLNLDSKRGLFIDLTRGQFGFKYDGIIVEPITQSSYFPFESKISKSKIDDTTKAISPKLDELFLAYQKYLS